MLDGEGCDVGLTNPWYVDEMISRGLTIGAAGPEPKHIESSNEGLRRLLLDAESIAYTSIGTSGKTFPRANEMMGLQDQLRDRLRPMGAGEPPIAAAKGEVQYAIAPLSRIVAAPEVTAMQCFVNG